MLVDKNVVAVVVTGMEYSGTTLLGNLLNSSIENAGGGFECGLLLANTPKEFNNIQPFYKWFCTTEKIGHWGLSEENRDKVLATDSFLESYIALAQEYSIVVDKTLDKIIDKTPRYIFELPSVCSKIENEVPLLITQKNIFSLYNSYKKRNYSLLAFSYRISKFIYNLHKVSSRDNVRLVTLESMVKQPSAALKELSKLIPSINIEDSVQLNYKLNPLKSDYDIELEYKKAIKQLNGLEKFVLNIFNKRLQYIERKFIVL